MGRPRMGASLDDAVPVLISSQKNPKLPEQSQS
jgi:hypothetical protein